jgi:hypothetical protein
MPLSCAVQYLLNSVKPSSQIDIITEETLKRENLSEDMAKEVLNPFE